MPATAPLQVVCGAPNARAGMVGVFGAPGAYVPGSDLTLEGRGDPRRRIQRHDVLGRASSSWATTMTGSSSCPPMRRSARALPTYAGLDDPVFDVAITPNRPDCMGVRGIARDLAAAGLGTLKPLDVPQIEGRLPSPARSRSAPTTATAARPSTAGRSAACTNGATPEWMQRRLRRPGQRPISALVDITNYVMLDLGRPAHAYDLAKLNGAVCRARARATASSVLALNGKDYALQPFMTVIADDAGVHDIGGIMGGEHLGCHRGDHRRAARNRLFHARADRADRPGAGA